MPDRPKRMVQTSVSAAVLIVLLATSVGAAWWWTHPMRSVRRDFARQEWSAALRGSLAYLETHPDSVRARLVVAQCYFQLGRWADAAEAFGNITALDWKDRERHALALTRSGRLDEAYQVYRALGDERPDDPHFIEQLAAVLIAKREVGQALELCKRLQEYPSHRRSAQYLSATCHYHNGEYAQALPYFEALLADPPSPMDPLVARPLFWQDYGSTLFMLGDLERAGKQMERAAVLYPTAEILDLLAKVYEARGEIERAERTWETALGQDSAHVPSLRSLARSQLRSGRPDRAAQYLLQAIDATPHDPSLHAHLAAAYDRAGKKQESEAAARRAELLRQLEELKEQYKTAAQRSPRGAEARLLAAIRDLENDRVPLAENKLRALVAEDAQFTPAKQLLELLRPPSTVQ